jgi:hypothetical protein
MLERLKTEEGLINAFVLISWIFLMPIIAFRLFSEFALLAVGMFALVLLGMLISALWSRKSSSLKGLKSDERTEKYVIKSARNGFLMTVALTGFLTVLTFIRGPFLDAMYLLIWIWLWATAAYQLSYLYYVMKG